MARIGILGHNLVNNDGQGRWMLEIARALADRHEVSIFSTRLDDSLKGHPGVRWAHLYEAPGPQLLIDMGIVIASQRHLSRTNLDLALTLGPCALPRIPYLYCAAFSQVGWRSTWTPESRPRNPYHRTHSAVALVLERRAVSRSAGTIAMSESTADELRPLMSAGATIDVVPGGVDIDEHPRIGPEERRRAREELGVEGRFVMSLVGGFGTWRKGLHLLLSAMTMNPDESESLLIRGGGPIEMWRAKAASMGLEGKIQWLGHGPSRSVYAASDLVVIPSTYEPFSLVALEAAAAGLPIVISSRAGASRWLKAQEAALTVDPVDIGALRCAIDTIKNDSDAAVSMGIRARSVAESMTWQKVSELGVAAVDAHLR